MGLDPRADHLVCGLRIRLRLTLCAAGVRYQAPVPDRLMAVQRRYGPIRGDHR